MPFTDQPTIIQSKPTGHYDSNGREYYTGDLVYNPFFGDIWLVDTFKPSDNPEPDDSPYCLVLWCNRNEYIIDIDEPGGFIIESRMGDDNYIDLYNECIQISKSHDYIHDD